MPTLPDHSPACTAGTNNQRSLERGRGPTWSGLCARNSDARKAWPPPPLVPRCSVRLTGRSTSRRRPEQVTVHVGGGARGRRQCAGDGDGTAAASAVPRRGGHDGARAGTHAKRCEVATSSTADSKLKSECNLQENRSYSGCCGVCPLTVPTRVPRAAAVSSTHRDRGRMACQASPLPARGRQVRAKLFFFFRSL